MQRVINFFQWATNVRLEKVGGATEACQTAVNSSGSYDPKVSKNEDADSVFPLREHSNERDERYVTRWEMEKPRQLRPSLFFRLLSQINNSFRLLFSFNHMIHTLYYVMLQDPHLFRE